MTADEVAGADEVRRLERELLGTAARSSPQRLEELLDVDLIEFGASGRRWDRTTLIAELVREELPLDAAMRQVEVAELAPEVLLLTYEAEVEGSTSLRSSIWWRRDGGWRLRFHHGTPRPAGAA